MDMYGMAHSFFILSSSSSFVLPLFILSPLKIKIKIHINTKCSLFKHYNNLPCVTPRCGVTIKIITSVEPLWKLYLVQLQGHVTSSYIEDVLLASFLTEDGQARPQYHTHTQTLVYQKKHVWFVLISLIGRYWLSLLQSCHAGWRMFSVHLKFASFHYFVLISCMLLFYFPFESSSVSPSPLCIGRQLC